MHAVCGLFSSILCSLLLGLAKTPAMPVARAPGAMDEPNPACLAPINITFPIAYTYGPFSNSGTCAGDEPCVFAFFTAGPSGASGQGAAVNVLADPYHIEVFSVNESVVVTLNTAQFDPATVTCVTTASTYPLEPSIVQSSTSIVITAGSSTTTATAGITCFLKVRWKWVLPWGHTPRELYDVSACNTCCPFSYRPTPGAAQPCETVLFGQWSD